MHTQNPPFRELRENTTRAFGIRNRISTYLLFSLFIYLIVYYDDDIFAVSTLLFEEDRNEKREKNLTKLLSNSEDVEFVRPTPKKHPQRSSIQHWQLRDLIACPSNKREFLFVNQNNVVQYNTETKVVRIV